MLVSWRDSTSGMTAAGLFVLLLAVIVTCVGFCMTYCRKSILGLVLGIVMLVAGAAAMIGSAITAMRHARALDPQPQPAPPAAPAQPGPTRAV